MISSIVLTNWRSHAETRLEFRPGTNLLIGIMGSGKSSVLDAISFALFGTFPLLERRKVNLEDIIRFDTEKSLVALEFEWDGANYRTERRIERGPRGVKTDAVLYRDNSIIDRGTTAVTQYIEQLLKVDYDLFTRAIYSEQNNIDYFLILEPKRRKKELDQLLGLDRFESARENLVSVINRTRSDKKVLEQMVDPNEARKLEQDKELNEKKLGEMSAEFKKYDEDWRNTTKELEFMQRLFEKMKIARQNYEQESKKLFGLMTSLKDIEAELGGKVVDDKEVEWLKQRKLELDAEVTQIEDAIKRTDRVISDASATAGRLELEGKNADERKQRLVLLEKKLNEMTGGKIALEIETQIKKADERMLSLSSERKMLEDSIRQFEGMKGRLSERDLVCPLCNSRITKDQIEHVNRERDENITEIRKRIELLKNEISTLQDYLAREKYDFKQITELMSRTNSLKEEKVDIAKIESELAEIGRRLEETKSLKAGYLERLRSLRAELNTVSIKLHDFENMLKKKDTAKKLIEDIKVCESRLVKLEFKEDEFESTGKRLEDVKISQARLAARMESLDKEIRILKELEKNLIRQIENIEKVSKQIKRLVDLEEQLLVYKNALLETQFVLRNNMVEAINSAMNEVWTIFYPYRNYHRVRVRIDEKDYVFELFDNRWRDLDTVASGGERACVALTLRVALAMVLTPTLSWLILDEPTHNLDNEAVKLLSETLQFKVPEVVKQTFVITHEESLMGSDFAGSYKLKRDKDNLGATYVERV